MENWKISLSLTLLLLAPTARGATECANITVRSIEELRLQKKTDLFPYNPDVYRTLFDFYKFDGEGTLISYDNLVPKYASGFYILIKYAPTKIVSDSSSLFLRDPRLSKYINDLVKNGVPVLLTHVGRGLLASVDDIEPFLSLVNCKFIHDAPATIEITDWTNLSTLKHEMQHYDDKVAGILDHIRSEVSVFRIKAVMSDDEEYWLSHYLMEQRAYSVEVKAAQEGTDPLEYVKDNNEIRTMNHEEYVKFVTNYRVDTMGRYTRHVGRTLANLRTKNIETYNEVLNLIKKYALPSETFSPSTLFPENFKSSKVSFASPQTCHTSKTETTSNSLK